MNLKAEVGAVVMEEGLAHVCLGTENLSLPENLTVKSSVLIS